MMQIAASDIMEKMIKKLRRSQGKLDAGAIDKEDMKSTLISVKVYCDLLLDELDTDTKASISEKELIAMMGVPSVKSNTPKATPYDDDDDDGNGDSIFDF